MKIKSFMMMMVAAAAVVLGVSSCGSDDDDKSEASLAEQVVGSYTGEEIMTVSGEKTPSNKTYVFTNSDTKSVDMTIPPTNDEGGMQLPALLVKGITLKKNGNTILGTLVSYSGTVTNASGAEKAYTVSDIALAFTDNTVIATYTLKYGNMPFNFTGLFTGKK